MKITVSKTKAGGKSLHLNLMGFKDEAEQDIWFKKIQQYVKENSERVKVF